MDAIVTSGYIIICDETGSVGARLRLSHIVSVTGDEINTLISMTNGAEIDVRIPFAVVNMAINQYERADLKERTSHTEFTL